MTRSAVILDHTPLHEAAEKGQVPAAGRWLEVKYNQARR